jgi:3-methyladenine DNA glycosylase Tag
VVENKKAGFRSAFANFSAERVAKFTERDIRRLVADAGIVRNEKKKIRSTSYKVARFQMTKKEYAPFAKCLAQFGRREKELHPTSNRGSITWERPKRGRSRGRWVIR